MSESLPSKRASSEHRLPRDLSLGENKTLIGSPDETSSGLPYHQSGFSTKSKNPPKVDGLPAGAEQPRFPCKVYYVGRRGKPSTWLPRQKLAEERKIRNVIERKTEEIMRRKNEKNTECKGKGRIKERKQTK